MKPTTSTYKQILASGNTRKFVVRIEFTLADDTELVLTEADIMDGSFKYSTASSSTTSFDLGSAVIGMCSFSLENFDERFSQYDFFNATAVVWLKLVGDTEYMRMGFFTVDEPEYAGAIVSLELLDNMWKFDVPLSEAGVGFPISCRAAVQRLCVYNGVTLATPDFHGADYVIAKKPEQDMNCREFLSYIAMITCNFCVIDSEGKLRLRWYTVSDKPADDLDGGTFSTRTTPYSDGDTANGGNFTNYSSGDSYDGGTFLGMAEIPQFTRNFSLSVGTDEITITGVKITIDNVDYQIGNDGYVLTLENPLVDASNVNAVLNLIWDRLNGFSFRTFSLKTLPDIACEVGDRCIVKDLKGNFIYTSISYISIGLSSMEVHCDAVSPTRNLTKRYSKAVSQSVEMARKVSEDSISAYDVAVQNMNNLAIHAIGAYQDYEELVTGGRVYYLSSKPITKDANGKIWLTNGAPAFKTTGEGLFVSQSGATDPDDRTWTNGYNAQTGELIVNVLYTIGLHADWIIAGLLKSANFINSEGDYSIAGTMFNIADGVIKSKNFAIDEDGIVHIANGAIIGGYATEDELNGYAKESELASGTTIINGGCITTGLIKDRQNKFSLNMETGAISMQDGSFSGNISASTGNFGALKINSNDASIYAEGVLTLMDEIIYLDTSGADRKYTYDLIVDTSYFSSDTYIGYRYYTTSGANNDYLGTVSLYRYYADGSIGSRLEYISVYAVSEFSQSFSEHMYANSGMYLFRFNLNYNGYYRSLRFIIKTSSTLKSLLFSGVDGIIAPSIKGALRGKIQASDFTCGGWHFENKNKKSFVYGEVNSSEDYVRLDVFYGLTMNYSVQNLRMHVGLTDISRVENGVTWYAQFYQGSDRRIKENIKPIDTDLSVKLIDKTEPKSFTFIHDTGTHYGMIAQEARKVLDELGEHDAQLEHKLNLTEPPVPDMRTIEYVEYIPHLINYVKELKSEINELKAELKELKEGK